MSDLRTLMHEAVEPSTAPTTDVVRADRARGDRALRRHRAAQLGGGTGLIAVAAVGVFALVAPNTAVSPPAPPPAASRTVESAPSLTGTALVAYTGPQPVGYTLDKVPARWKVRSSDVYGLTLAPEGAPTPAEPTPDKNGISSPVSNEGTINIGIQSNGVPSGVPLDKVMINGRPGAIAHLKGGAEFLTLFAKQPSGVYLEIRAWTGLGWDNDRLVEFAESVHITMDAVKVRG